MTTVGRRRQRGASAAVLCLLLLACAACSGRARTRSGGSNEPVRLTIAAGTPNSLTGETTQYLVSSMKRFRSTGFSLRRVQDAGGTDGSTTLLALVRDGTIDVGVVASRVFDLFGVTSLQAFSSPLTTESPEQAVALLDDPVADEMLAGVTKAGVVAVGLAYDQLREPLSYGGQILAPEDLQGSAVLARPGKVMADTLAAVGAKVDRSSGNAATAAIDAGRVTAYEASVERPIGPVIGPPGRTSTLTANVHLSIRVNVFVVNAKVWHGLSPAQRQALRDSARRTRDWAAGQARSLRRAAAAFCTNRLGDVVVADPAQLQAWRRAVRPVVDAMAARDPVTRRALARLRTLARDHPVSDPPIACRAVGSAAASGPPATGSHDGLTGVWRLQVEGRRLSDAGASSQEVALNSGVWTFTFRADGTYAYVEPRGRSCPGTFAINGHRLAMDEHGADCDGRWRFTFDRRGDRLRVVPSSGMVAEWRPVRAFFINPFVRIGNAPP